MKVLVYGAGVLGSFLAYALDKAGHEVSILARGKRLHELREHGLVIVHHKQKQTTTSRVETVETLGQNDFYDAVFVVMQKTQISAVVPILADNEKSQVFCFVGNKCQAHKTRQQLLELSKTNPAVLFAFLGVGGRNEEGKILSYHRDAPSFTVGDITKESQHRAFIDTLFEKSGLTLYHPNDMDAWLKYHLAVILPAVYAIQYAQGDMKKLSKSTRMLKLMLQAINEGFSVLKEQGFPPEPENIEDVFKKPMWLLLLLLKLVVRTKTFELAARDHAMSAINEMSNLSDDFSVLQEGTAASAPALDELRGYLLRP